VPKEITFARIFSKVAGNHCILSKNCTLLSIQSAKNQLFKNLISSQPVNTGGGWFGKELTEQGPGNEM
jgi:hypothetical protein